MTGVMTGVMMRVMMGFQVTADEVQGLLLGGQRDMAGGDDDEEELVLQAADRVRQVIDDCRRQYVADDEIVVGSWGLVDAHPLTGDPDPTQVDMDTILILTRHHLHVVSYGPFTCFFFLCSPFSKGFYF